MFSKIRYYRTVAKRTAPTMRVMKVIQTLFFVLIMSSTARASVLFEDASNYPYANGSIEGQGQWYCFNPAIPYGDARVTNNVLLLNVTNNDAVAAPANGWSNPSGITYASFMINVSELPNQNSQLLSESGPVCQLQSANAAATVCNVFIDTRGTSVPGTYQLGIAGFDTSLASVAPPDVYPMDLATDIWYNVVILFDTNQNDAAYGLDGATLWINPSLQDYANDLGGVGFGQNGVGTGYVNALDETDNTNLSLINVSQIGFNSNADAGISNVIVGTEFTDVLRTNPPVFGIQPQSGTVYSGNSFTLYAVASGADLNYQWYDNSGPLTDGLNITGSTNDILIVNNPTNSDIYFCVVTDAYGLTANSFRAIETLVTVPTPVFFPANETAITNYANEFTTTGFTNVAAGTGPIFYQWYFASAGNPTIYSPLRGQTGPVLVLSLDGTNFQGNYYVTASTNQGSLVFGPTNTLVEPSALTLNMPQLHALVQSYSNQIAAHLTSAVSIGTNNVSVTGYVVQFDGFGSTYSEYYIADASGLGALVHLENAAENLDNSLNPPIGTCVTVTGQLEIVHNQIAIVLSDPNGVAIVPNAPSMTISPMLANGLFNGFVTNGLGTNAFLYNASLVTFTNVYIYGDKGGDPVANGGAFFADSFTTEYFTTGGPYNPATGHTNMLELYQFSYDYTGGVPNEFDNAPIPTNCFQLTGIYVDYDGAGRLEPSRLVDYVVSAPSLAAALTDTNGVPKVFWQLQPGSTYSLYSTTNLSGPWTRATGLAYYPANVVPFTDTNGAPAKFYYISSP